VKLPGSVTRNAAGLPATVTIGDLDTTYTYNAHGEVLTETTTDGQGVVFARAYTRDALGRITQVDETEGANTRRLFYNYDIAGRLVAECQGTAVGQGEIDDPCGEDTALIAEYTYDANGNRLSRDEPGGDVDEEAEYDAQDRLVDYDGVAHTFGDRGELQSAGAWGFDQDAHAGADEAQHGTACRAPGGREEPACKVDSRSRGPRRACMQSRLALPGAVKSLHAKSTRTPGGPPKPSLQRTDPLHRR
jgi:YD repeat-containing protein